MRCLHDRADGLSALHNQLARAHTGPSSRPSPELELTGRPCCILVSPSPLDCWPPLAPPPAGGRTLHASDGVPGQGLEREPAGPRGAAALPARGLLPHHQHPLRLQCHGGAGGLRQGMPWPGAEGGGGGQFQGAPAGLCVLARWLRWVGWAGRWSSAGSPARVGQRAPFPSHGC